MERSNIEHDLQERFETITGLNDFKIVLESVCDPHSYGEYFIEEREIHMYILDDDGTWMDRRTIEQEALHELAHHIQIHHTKRYTLTERTAHGYVFKKQFTRLLKRYYNGIVPGDIWENQRERGYLVG